jgi:DtxR family Mn-dependent transcriptional regulator
VAVGSRVCIQRVGDRDPEQLRYLAELGIMPGRRVEVLARAPFDGPISLRVGRLTRTIGAVLAKRILVGE